MNAYELADKLDWHWDNDCRSPAISKSADMLRQQADRIADLETTLAFKKMKPLSDEEIHELANKHLRTQNQDSRLIVLGLEDFAKAIEERHGIK